MRHFKLTETTKISILGTKLFQVELTIDCKFGKKGDKGGFVEKEENLKGDDAWLYKNANIERTGVIMGGEIMGGEIRGGVIMGGVIWGGVIWGGVIWGGEIWGGEIWGGEIIKTPLQFIFNKHYAIVCKPNYLRIGCNEFTFEYWKENFKKIGKENNYTNTEIEAYGIIIDMALKIGNDCFKLD